MILKELHIERNTYDFDFRGIKAGELAGKIAFSNGEGSEIKINLTGEQASQIIKVVAEALIDTAQSVARILVEDVIEASPSALTHET